MNQHMAMQLRATSLAACACSPSRQRAHARPLQHLSNIILQHVLHFLTITCTAYMLNHIAPDTR